tara:strand:- start:1536 stop:2087 length:552 start_codon:yes stop_codon:yes gene_type:complete
MTSVSKDECLELKNINYQTMLLNNKTNIDGNMTSECSEKIENFLMKEKEMNKNKSWSKLSKASKLKKLMFYATNYCKKHKYDNNEEKKLKSFLMEALDRRKLQKIKDVIYDIEKGVINDIPKLLFLKDKKRFTIKRDKKSNTLQNLAPKTLKKKRIKKNKKNKEDKIKKIKRKIKKKEPKTEK